MTRTNNMIEGLLDRVRDPNVSQGLLAAGNQMMQAGSQGQNVMQAAGQGMAAYNQAYQQSEAARKQQLIEQMRQQAVTQITDPQLQELVRIGGPEALTQVLVEQLKPKAGIAPTDDQREYAMAVQQGFKGSLFDYMTQLKRAGATNFSPTIDMTGGQKGFDNELKLRADFRVEPIYKAHEEMTSAYKQIETSLKQESPAGDMAAATKIMKLLDPGSVVRESELAMAMQASGSLDRLQNYVQMKVSGQKLTPQQRVDFKNLADQLMAATESQYATKASEYESFAKDYGLNPLRVTGRATGKGSKRPLSAFGG